MLEILTMGAVYQNKNLISRLFTEEKLEAYTTAGHKIEFCFFNTANGQRQLFGAIECNTDKYKQEFGDVNETISELSYLTHSYFRYYGKFPSKIGKLIIEDLDRKKLITPENDFVLDNYAGSGTTLVEAKLKNYDSFGIDINPFAVLACKVKARNYNMASLRSYWLELQNEIIAYNQSFLNPDIQQLIFVKVQQDMIDSIQQGIKKFKSLNKAAEKWFSENALIGVGDCTLQENLFEVHKAFITLLENIGFVTDKIVYRSTFYGIGQYAYKHRAAYNEDANRKKDAVLFFTKP